MTKRAPFVSRVRLHAALCSAAILVSACGGSADTMGEQQMLSTQTIASPADVSTGAAPGATGFASTVDMAQTEPAATTPTAPVPEATPAATYPAAAGTNSETAHANTTAPAANFELSGYQSTEAAPATDAVQAPR